MLRISMPLCRILPLIALCGWLNAADPDHTWEQLARLQRGDTVRVVLANKRDFKAQFVAAAPNTLQLLNGATPLDLQRTDVRRVYQVRHRSKLRAAAPYLGAAGGFAVGFAIGWKTGDPSGCAFCLIPRSALAPAAAVPTAGAGFVIGHFAAGSGETLIYRSK